MVCGCNLTTRKKETDRHIRCTECGRSCHAEARANGDLAIVDLKDNLKDVKNRYNRVLRNENNLTRILGRITEVTSAIAPVKPAAPMKVRRGDKTVESAVLVGSCWHIGEKIDRQAMGDLNEYNFEIFKARLQYMIEHAINFTLGNMSSHAFEEIHLILTGDMVSGIIHEELVESNELHIVDQTLYGAHIAAQAIQDLARVFPRVVVTGVVGNHGRTQHAKEFKNKGSKSWDYVFYNALAMLLQGQKNVQFVIPKSYWGILDIQGHLCQVQHGDTIKSWGGIPFYGLNRETSKWVEIHATRKEFVEYYITSHFHTKAILQSGIGERIMNGSLKGGDEYAIGLGLFGDPIQLLFGMHKQYGKTWELSLNMKHAPLGRSRYRCDLTKPIALQLDTVAAA